MGWGSGWSRNDFLPQRREDLIVNFPFAFLCVSAVKFPAQPALSLNTTHTPATDSQSSHYKIQRHTAKGGVDITVKLIFTDVKSFPYPVHLGKGDPCNAHGGKDNHNP